MDRYEKWKPSDELKTALAPGGGVDTAALDAIAGELSNAYARFMSEWDAIKATYSLAENASNLDQSPSDLVNQVDADVRAAEREATALETLIGLLNDDSDIRAGECSTRCEGTRDVSRPYRRHCQKSINHDPPLQLSNRLVG